MITLDILSTICPKTKTSVLETYVTPLNEVAQYYDMFDNKNRVAAFVAQTAHESGGFNFVKENLNYSAKGLVGTFHKYFKDEEFAKQYANVPPLVFIIFPLSVNGPPGIIVSGV